MNVSKQIVFLFLFILLFAVACTSDDNPSLPTVAPAASVEQPATTNGNALPATNTPASSINASTPNNNDIETIDEAVQKIDTDVCREAHETLTELDGLLAQGQDVADLKTAVIELITELDNCALDATPTP
jgi:Na+-transporting methylmalonyl-CoA/oxaloacetate decarboxylase gamma subunit